MRAPGAFRQTGIRSIEVREGGGCLGLFGLPFLAAGLFVSGIALGLIPVENASDVPGWGRPLILLMGLAFAAVGGGLALGRRWTVLDLSRRKVIRQRGLLVPMWRRESSLDGYEAVVIRHDAGDSDSPDRYPVVLRSRGRAEDLTLKSASDYADAREQATYLADFLDLPLEDASTDRVSVIGPDRLDAPLRERMRAEGRGTPLAERPRETRSSVCAYGEGVRITIPGSGFRPATLLGAVIPIGILVFVVPRLRDFFRSTDTPREVGLVFIGFGVLVLGVIPLLGTLVSVLRAKRRRTTVTAGPNGIVLEERFALRTRTTRIDSEDIVGLDFHAVSDALAAATREAAARGDSVPAVLPRLLQGLSRFVKSEGVTIKSRRGLFKFGAGLSDHEVRYLESVVRAALVGGQP